MTATLNPLMSGGTPDLRHSNGLIRGTAEQCPPVDSNHAPLGSEPSVLSAELDGPVRAVGIEPTLSEDTGFTGRLTHLRRTLIRAGRVQPSGTRDHCTDHARYRRPKEMTAAIPYEVLEAESKGFEPSGFTLAWYSTPVADRSALPSMLGSTCGHRCRNGLVPTYCRVSLSPSARLATKRGKSRDRTVALADGAS